MYVLVECGGNRDILFFLSLFSASKNVIADIQTKIHGNDLATQTVCNFLLSIDYMGREVLNVKTIPSIWTVIEGAFSFVDNGAGCINSTTKQVADIHLHRYLSLQLNLSF
jgi:hypothetical protein